MARVYSDYPLSGRQGNIVYFVRNGKTFSRIYKKPNDPRTPDQLINRAKMRAAGSFLKLMKDVIRRGFQSPDNHTTPFLEAQSYLMAEALTPITPTNGQEYQFEVNLPAVKLASGKINPPDITSIQRNDSEILLSWDKSLGPVPNRFYDSMNLVGYISQKKALWYNDLGTRESGAGRAILPKGINEPVHFWAFFSNEQKSTKPDKVNVSDSIYLGVL